MMGGMRIYRLDKFDFGKYHEGHLVVLAPDLDAAIEAFADHLLRGDVLRLLVEQLVEDGRDYEDRDWEHPIGGYAPYVIPVDEVKAILHTVLRQAPWQMIDPSEASTPLVLAYNDGSC